MWQTILNAVIPIVITGIIGILAIVIRNVGDVAIEYIVKKKEQIANKIGIDNYNAILSFGVKVWGLVDEYFRITPNVTKTIESAQAMFKEEILKKFPNLTDTEIDQIRQIIAGEVNKGREIVVSPTTESK